MDSENMGEINVFNPSKDLAKEVTLQVLIRHRDATHQAREGFVAGQEEEPPENQKKFNKVKGLYKMISAQREMVNISRPIVKFRCLVQWKKKYETEEKKTQNPFEEQENDYTELMFIKKVLAEAEFDIIKAERTSTTKDDYLIEIQDNGEKKFVLTLKYFEMLEGLEDTYEKIDMIMLKHKIISAGIEEDEVRSYKEQEQEAIKRVINA